MPGHIRKRKERFHASVAVPRVADGPLREYRAFDTEKEASLWIAARTYDIAVDGYVAPSARTVCEVFEEFFATAHMGDQTRCVRQSAARRFVDQFGSWPLQQVSAVAIERFFVSLRSAAHLRSGRPGLADSTIENIVRVVRLVFAWATRRQYLVRDTAARIQRPKRLGGRDMTVLSRPETKRLIETIRGHALEVPVLVALMGGLRRGEALGLRIEDLDPLTGHLSVRRAYTMQPRGPRLGLTKTRNSNRTLLLPAETVGRLREILASREWSSDFLSASSNTHGPWSPAVLTHEFKLFLRRNGFRPMRFHDLRHTHAALLIAADVHIKVISLRLGHASIQVTMDTYGHLIPGVEDASMLKLTLYVEGPGDASEGDDESSAGIAA